MFPALPPAPSPGSIAVPDAAEALAIRTAIDATLAKRSVAGVFAYLLLLAIFLVATPALEEYPTAGVAALAWMVVLGVVRLGVARSFGTSYERRPARWVAQFRVATLLAGTSWGAGCALWTHAMGLGAASMIMLVATAGVTAGAMSSLGPSVRLARAYLACMLGPTILDLVLRGDGSRVTFGFATVLVLYLAFLTVESSRHHEAFVLAARRAFLLEQRAAELAERNRRMKIMLDTVGQGFLGVTPDGCMFNERSAILERWLGPCGPADTVWDYLGRVAPEAGLWLELGLTGLAAGVMPVDLVVAQMPRRFRAADRHIDIEYRPTLVGTTVTKVLMILSDVTNQVERERSEQEQSDLLRVFERITTDRAGVVEFVAEMDRLVEQLAVDENAAAVEVRRWIHTLKGNAAIYGLEALSRTCHDLESVVDESGEPVNAVQRAALVRAWHANADRIKSLLGGDKPALQVTCAEYTELLDAIEAGASRVELVQAMRQWKLEPTEIRLLRFAQHARSLAHRLEKGDIAVVIEANGLRLPADRFGPFWSAFVHVVRNAVDHGLETPDDRLALGKPGAGTLTVRTFVEDTELVVSLADDGRGIDWARVASTARLHGLPHETPAELEAVLFADGISTKEVATELSGRGVGMGAVLSEVRGLGGRLTVVSESGRGTRWTARFPRGAMERERAVPVAA